jgi:hypothetical protein
MTVLGEIITARLRGMSGYVFVSLPERYTCGRKMGVIRMGLSFN